MHNNRFCRQSAGDTALRMNTNVWRTAQSSPVMGRNSKMNSTAQEWRRIYSPPAKPEDAVFSLFFQIRYSIMEADSNPLDFEGVEQYTSKPLEIEGVGSTHEML